MDIIVDYGIAKECQNKKAWYICLKCGKCGRVFDPESGIMVNDGGTHDLEGEV